MAESSKPSMSVTAIIGFIVGIISLIVAWFPYLDFFGVGCGVVGLVFSIIGLVATADNKKRGRVFAIIGLVVSIVAILGGALMAILYTAVFVANS